MTVHDAANGQTWKIIPRIKREPQIMMTGTGTGTTQEGTIQCLHPAALEIFFASLAAPGYVDRPSGNYTSRGVSAGARIRRSPFSMPLIISL